MRSVRFVRLWMTSDDQSCRHPLPLLRRQRRSADEGKFGVAKVSVANLCYAKTWPPLAPSVPVSSKNRAVTRSLSVSLAVLNTVTRWSLPLKAFSIAEPGVGLVFSRWEKLFPNHYG